MSHDFDDTSFDQRFYHALTSLLRPRERQPEQTLHNRAMRRSVRPLPTNTEGLKRLVIPGTEDFGGVPTTYGVKQRIKRHAARRVTHETHRVQAAQAAGARRTRQKRSRQRATA